jgi:tight adherence protein C
MLAVLAALVAVTSFVVFVAIFGFKSDASRRVAELEFASRPAAAPSTSKVMTRILAGVDKNQIAARLAEAGWYRTTVAQFVTVRLSCAGVGAVLGGLGALALHQNRFVLLAALAFAVGGLIAPTFALDGAVKKRKLAISRRMPDMLDMVATTVEAGTALNAALATAAQSLHGPLAEEIEIVLSDVRLGRSRADAFSAMGKRAKQQDLSGFVTAVVQTERLGGNIGNVLDELAQEARSRRLARAEEIAARLPVLMILPMAFFLLPALFVVIFTPVVAQLVGR